VIEPKAAPMVATEEKSSPVLRDDDGGESHAPAFLKAPGPAPPRPKPPLQLTPVKKPPSPPVAAAHRAASKADLKAKKAQTFQSALPLDGTV